MARREAVRHVAAQRMLRKRLADSQTPSIKATGPMLSGGRGSRGGYEGARKDIRELKGWDPRDGSAASDTIPDLPTLRGRTHDLDRNVPLATGIFETNLDNVIGTGLYPVPAPDAEELGISVEEARAFGRKALKIYNTVMDTTRLHLGDRMTGLQQTWALFRSVLAGGDAFAVRRFKERPGDLLGLKVQYLEAGRVGNPNDSAGSATLMDGIEFDGDGRIERVWARSQHAGENLYYAPTTWSGLAMYGAATGERQILHCLEQRRFDQPRGVPILAPVIKQLRQSGEIIDNELTAAQVQSLFTVFIRSALDAEEGPGIESLPNGSQHYGPPVEAQELRLGRGLLARLNPGEDIVMANTNRPNTALDPFLNSVFTMSGAGTSMPFEVLTKRFNSSYSAARAAMLAAWRTFDRRQTWMVETAMQYLYGWIIDEAVLRGYLDAPGFHDDPYVRQAYLRASWRGPTREQLDELKEVLAAERRVNAGFSTIAHETSGLTGLDPDQVHAQRALEVQQRVAAGLEAPAQVVGATPSTPPRARDMAPTSPNDGGDVDPEPATDRTLVDPTTDTDAMVREVMFNAVA